MTMKAVRLAVSETPGQVGDFPPVRSLFVLNSGFVDIVVDNVPVALEPQQIGCRLIPGEGITLPRVGSALTLYAVALAEGGQLQAVINPAVDDAATFGG
jgi:hypothetical protein